MSNLPGILQDDSGSSDDDTYVTDPCSDVTFSQVFGGTLIFQSVTADDLRQDYVLLDKDMSMEDLGSFISQYWKLRTPKIVLSVISNCEYFDGGTDSDVEDFQLGLIQAARLTSMWILTEGINAGVPRIVGEAVAQERVKRKILEKDISRNMSGQLVVIGVLGSDDLVYGDALQRATQPVERYSKFVIENTGDDSHELNPYHTHFLIINSQEDKDAKWNTRFIVESKLVQYVTKKHIQKKETEWKNQYHFPVVGLLVQGGPKEIERVLWLLRKQIPVIVIKRKGYASGLVAYAYSEGMKGGESQHLENIVKPQLMQQVREAFPEYCQENEVGGMQCRDKILECVKHAVQGECRYLTVLDPSQSGVDQKDLNKFILTAIFNARKADLNFNSRENINRHLRLTLDWNTPEFARREILPKVDRIHFRIKEELFLEALLQPQREQFVELFLNMGLQLHHFVTETRLMYLYEDSLDNDFFVHVCLERILHRSALSLGKNFLSGTNCSLNKILFALTGLRKLINPDLLFLGRVAQKYAEKQIAERKALLALIYWAVLTNRQALAKVLWKKTSEPIAVALVISNMYYRISKHWIDDLDLKKTLKNASVNFGVLAIEMMDLVFNDSSLMAFYSLVNPLSDFNNLNVVDLALIGNNIFFIAHPCCQRSMHARWQGRIKIKSSDIGPIHIPQFVKIYLCMFLIFPMYFWVSFTPGKRKHVQIEDDDSQEDNTEEEKKSNQDFAQYLKRYGGEDPYMSPPLWRKIYYLWTAPVCKFWLNQLFLIAYLALFAAALMLPYCGNMYINMVLCGWTAILFIDHVITTIKTMLKYQTFDYLGPVLSMLLNIYITCVSGLLVFQQMYKVTPINSYVFLDYMDYKFLMSLGMLFVYFRSLKYILPVSHDLGPMFVNISQLTRRDLINWFLLWMVCFVSGGVAINAVVYPAQPVTNIGFWHFQFRALLAIFLTEVEDLQGQPSCTPLYDVPEITYTCNVSTIHPYVRSRLENCPYASLAGYAIVIQQLLITRHVFYILMFSMFSVTTNRTKERSVEIWKYQFYLMVTDFEKRPLLPVPLTPLTYPFSITFFLAKAFFWCVLSFRCCRKIRERFESSRREKFGIPYKQWKYYMGALTKKEDEKETHIQDILGQLEEDSAAHAAMIRRVNEKMVTVERNQILAGFVLENIINSLESLGRFPDDFPLENIRSSLESLDPSSPLQKGQRRPVHTASRRSPYRGTHFVRFPVLEKDVSWDVQFESYDPGTYTKPVEEFPLEVQQWVDRDILKLPVQLIEEAPSVAEDAVIYFPYGVMPDPVFNIVQTVTLPDDKEINIDRVSYMRVGDGPLVYEIESTGVPRNPMGRTGLRGRGSLWKWGPNHMIQAIISRWKSMSTPFSIVSGQIVESGTSKKMEILVVQDRHDGLNLPGDIVGGSSSPYSVMCNCVMRDILQEADLDIDEKYDQDDMIEYFSQFASSDMKKKKKSMHAALGYSAFLIYLGYADDPLNTDNAWKETEIWNFHYKYKNCFDALIKENGNVTWEPVTSQINLPPSELLAVMEAQKMHSSSA